MANQQSQQTQLTPLQNFNRYITNPRTQDYLKSVLHEKKSSFINNITALVCNNTMLQPCKPDSLMFACLKATALDLPLDPNLGFAYVLPYKDNKAGVTVAQFQMGYKGFIQLAIRTGLFKTINAKDVRQGELVSEDFITGEYTFKKAENRESLPVIGYVAYFRLLSGFEKSMYMTKQEVDAHAKRYSQTYKKGYGLWADKDMFDSMALKTVLKLLISKYAPLSVEMKSALQSDQATFDENGNPNYIDRPEDQEQPKNLEEATKKKKEDMRQRNADGHAPAEDPMP